MTSLQIILDYAIWAYEPNEEYLRSLLLDGCGKGTWQSWPADDESEARGGYRLIVHRNTNYVDPTEKVTASLHGDDSTDTQSTKKSKKKNNMRKPPGRVGYFVAISETQQKMLVGIKGTSTLEELLTDCCGRAVRVDLENDPHCFHYSSTLDENDSDSDAGVDNDVEDGARGGDERCSED